MTGRVPPLLQHWRRSCGGGVWKRALVRTLVLVTQATGTDDWSFESCATTCQLSCGVQNLSASVARHPDANVNDANEHTFTHVPHFLDSRREQKQNTFNALDTWTTMTAVAWDIVAVAIS